MKNKSILAIAGLIISIPVLIQLGPASASPRGACMMHGNMMEHRPDAMAGMPFGGRIFRMMESLDLSAEQREEIQGLLDKSQTQIRPHMQALFEGRKQLQAVISGDYDKDEVQKSANEQAKIMAELIVLRTEIRYHIQSVLTPEQRARFKELRGPGCERFQQQGTIDQ